MTDCDCDPLCDKPRRVGGRRSVLSVDGEKERTPIRGGTNQYYVRYIQYSHAVCAFKLIQVRVQG